MLVPWGERAEDKLQPVDFAAMTCDQFWQKTPPSDRGPFLFWLSGYFGHKNNSAVLDPTAFTEKTTALSQYCAKQPNDKFCPPPKGVRQLSRAKAADRSGALRRAPDR